jgi:hypothetical protein
MGKFLLFLPLYATQVALSRMVDGRSASWPEQRGLGSQDQSWRGLQTLY